MMLKEGKCFLAAATAIAAIILFSEWLFMRQLAVFGW